MKVSQVIPNCPFCAMPLTVRDWDGLPVNDSVCVGLPSGWKTDYEGFKCRDCGNTHKPSCFILLKGILYYYHNNSWHNPNNLKKRKGKLIGGWPVQ